MKTLKMWGIVGATSLIVGISLFLISGCETATQNKNIEIPSSRFSVSNALVYPVGLMTDSETGCKYIIYDRGLSPLYGLDGKVVGCGKVENKQEETLK